MGFLSSWFEGLTEQYSKNQTTPSQGASRRLASRPPRGDDLRERAAPQAELEPDISQDEPLHQDKQRSLSAESSISTVLLGGNEKLLEHKGGERSSLSRDISIPCLVKKPKQPEVKGIIQKDLGDRFLVEVADKEISVSKLFVYPDLNNFKNKKCKTAAAEPDEKVSDTSSKCSSRIVPPSTNCSSKTRRKRGEGSGHIYYRTVTRNGKDYRQAYYQWRENGKQRTRYVPKKLLGRVEEAESLKLPVSDILVLLGGMGKCSSKSSITSNTPINDEVINDSDKCSSKVTPPSKSRRTKGSGTGYIECKPIKRCGKEYKQYWYHYEEWREGDRTSKKSRYIPKRLVARVEKMEAEKVSVREILEVLITKDKRS